MRIQAHWRGYQARKAFAPVWREHRDSQRERQAALAIQTVSTCLAGPTSCWRVSPELNIVCNAHGMASVPWHER